MHVETLLWHIEFNPRNKTPLLLPDTIATTRCLMLSQENELLQRLQAFAEQERRKIIVLLRLGSMNLNLRLFTILAAIMLRLNSRQCGFFVLQRRLRYLPSVMVYTYDPTIVM